MNAHICMVDAVVANALESAQDTDTPERYLEELAKKQQHYLGFKQIPELRKPLGSFGIVFQHQVLEGFLQDLEEYLRGKPSYNAMDPNGTDPRPKGEDMLRRLVRKLVLLANKQELPLSYKDENERDAALREEIFCSTVGNVETHLMEYYRLVRNAAVHADIDRIAENYYKAHFASMQSTRNQTESTLEQGEPQRFTPEKLTRLYKAKPSSVNAISIEDMILYSRVMQKVTRALLVMARPDIETEILPVLRKSFSRFESEERRRKAIVGALCTDYLLDANVAKEYASRG
ncbi:MAG: hypothetical protein U0324_34375 [Polyangiales bacterium]